MNNSICANASTWGRQTCYDAAYKCNRLADNAEQGTDNLSLYCYGLTIYLMLRVAILGTKLLYNCSDRCFKNLYRQREIPPEFDFLVDRLEPVRPAEKPLFKEVLKVTDTFALASVALVAGVAIASLPGLYRSSVCRSISENCREGGLELQSGCNWATTMITDVVEQVIRQLLNSPIDNCQKIGKG